MLPTPFGDLNTLDLDDRHTQLLILSHDKHQIIEGLVAEKDVDHILRAGFASSGHHRELNVVSVMAGTSQTTRRYIVVLDQGADAALLEKYLHLLSAGFHVKLVRYDVDLRDFRTHVGPYSAAKVLDQSYGDLAKALTGGRKPSFATVGAELKDAVRQQQGFWGQLVGAYDDRLGTDVVLPRIFKNFAVQPYFNQGVWDIDRVCWDEKRGRFCVIEVKHKYPFGKDPYPLSFGINCGSCSVLRDLAEVGLDCFHSIMVKPYWTDTKSSTYLFSDRIARARLLFCGKLFNLAELKELYGKKSIKSGKKQTLTGEGNLPWVPFRADSLFRLGFLDDTELPAHFVAAMEGKPTTGRVTDSELQLLRLDNKVAI